MLNEDVNEVREILNMQDGEERYKRIMKLLMKFDTNSMEVPPEELQMANKAAFSFFTVAGLLFLSYDEQRHSPENLLNMLQAAMGMLIAAIQEGDHES